MNHQELAERLFPNIKTVPEDMEKRYPERDLPEGAAVTRIAPSPTGFMHLGNLYGAVVDERLAHQSGGIFYLRIEDTDRKRLVENGVETIIKVFSRFGLNFDEGATLEEACLFAAAASAISVTRASARDSMPHRPETDAFLQQHK